MDRWLIEIWNARTGETIIAVIVASASLASWILTRFMRREPGDDHRGFRAEKLK